MKDFINTMKGLPIWAKLLLCIPMLDIVWVIYRIARSVDKKNTLGIVLGILLIFIGIPFLWLVDIITILVNGDVWWLD